MTEKNTERRAAELLDEYVRERLLGKVPEIESYLSRCPVIERECLKEAFGGLELLIEHQYTVVDDTLIDDTIGRILAIRRKKQQLALWQAQLSQWKASEATNPISELAKMIQIPPHDVSRQLSSGHYAQPSVRYRGAAAASARNKSYIDDARIALLEKRLQVSTDDILRRSRISKPPVDLRRLADELYLCVQEVPLDGADGCIVSTGETGAILINSRIDNAHRKRFTLAHEIGHFILHRHMSMHTDTYDAMNDYDSQEEEEANIFASMLLMPAFMLPQNFGADKPSFDQAERLQQSFEVSLSASMRRMVRQSHWGCAMALTQNGVLKWSVRSQYFDGWISSRPHPWSVAARLVASGDTAEGKDEVPMAAWIDGCEDGEGLTLREHSRCFHDGYVYTLLTLPDHK